MPLLQEYVLFRVPSVRLRPTCPSSWKWNSELKKWQGKVSVTTQDVYINSAVMHEIKWQLEAIPWSHHLCSGCKTATPCAHPFCNFLFVQNTTHKIHQIIIRKICVVSLCSSAWARFYSTASSIVWGRLTASNTDSAKVYKWDGNNMQSYSFSLSSLHINYVITYSYFTAPRPLNVLRKRIRNFNYFNKNT